MTYRACRLLGFVDGTLSTTDTEHRCQVRFSADEPMFKGHFPGHAVVPGVIMIEGLVALVEKATASRRVLSHVVEAKFRSEARPDDLLEYAMFRQELGYRAEITSGGREVLTAKLRLKDAV
jgi:3-hydroxyacyl-[acyl-carrier-protein] dehydratase